MASSSSSSSSSANPPLSSHQPFHFTPIQECEREEQEEEYSEDKSQSRATPSGSSYTDDKKSTPKHYPTPLHAKNGKNSRKRQDSNGGGDDDDGSVSCNKCRPHPREKISVVPLDGSNGFNKQSSFMASPNGIFKSIFSSLTRKSPRSKEDQWKMAIAELSHKLIQATRKRDEAILEASRLKHSMAELEKKLNKLEIYCHNLKSGLDECNSGNSPYGNNGKNFNQQQQYHHHHHHHQESEKVIEQFLISVSESRTSVRMLSRSLVIQLRHMSGTCTIVFDRISLLLQPYDIKISFSKNPKSLLFYLEALLNKTFFEDFESVGFQKSSVNQVLNPIDRCEANYSSFNVLKELTWEEVLSKGTRHFSEEFSKFCDRKMNEIVAMLGWNRAWPEPLLQAFFAASKSVWLVHLLANSVHPGLPIFRVDKGVRFESVYMEDMGGDHRARKLVPTMVRIMVQPGFYVYGNVVKCKVLSRYYSNVITTNDDNNKGLISSP